MALTLGDNFSYQGAKPLDGRLKYDTLAAMKAVADATMYDGCMAYCTGTDKTYQWKSTNTVDESTGKWREFSSGGGGTGGGHTIEDSEGTDLTQRSVMQFGEGFIAEDDDTNEKTVISPDIMQSGDMDDVVTPLPSIAPKKGGIKYSTTEQVIGEWIDGSPLWQKTINGINTPSSGDTDTTVYEFDSSVDMIHKIVGYAVDTSIPSQKGTLPINIYYNDNVYVTVFAGDKTSNNQTKVLRCRVGDDGWHNVPLVLTVQYTKTTT